MAQLFLLRTLTQNLERVALLPPVVATDILYFNGNDHLVTSCNRNSLFV